MLNSSNAGLLNVLIVSERPDHLHPLIKILDASSARVSACFTIRQAQEILARQSADLLFSDEYLSDGSYRELLQANRFRQNATSFVLLLRTGEWDEYLEAMRLGALEVLRCPLDTEEVETAVLRAVAQKEKRGATRLAAETASARLQRLQTENAADPGQHNPLFDELLGPAAAALVPEAASMADPQAATEPGDRQPEVIRRDVA